MDNLKNSLIKNIVKVFNIIPDVIDGVAKEVRRLYGPSVDTTKKYKRIPIYIIPSDDSNTEFQITSKAWIEHHGYPHYSFMLSCVQMDDFSEENHYNLIKYYFGLEEALLPKSSGYTIINFNAECPGFNSEFSLMKIHNKFVAKAEKFTSLEKFEMVKNLINKHSECFEVVGIISGYSDIPRKHKRLSLFNLFNSGVETREERRERRAKKLKYTDDYFPEWYSDDNENDYAIIQKHVYINN